MEKLNNLIHTYSSKPLLYGTRDALIVAVITVVILIIMAFVYYLATGNLKYMATKEYWMSVGKSFLMSMILGYVYEYGGINARFSAEAMRFAKGSTLDKYQTRNEALVAELAAAQYRAEVAKAVRENPSLGLDFTEINKNIDRINAMVRATRELKIITRMYDKPTDEILQVLKSRYQTHLTASDIDNLKNLDPSDPGNNLSRLNAVPRLVELFGTNEKLVQYFIKNGFSKLRSQKTMTGVTLDIKDLANSTGIDINLVGIGMSGKGKAATTGEPSSETEAAESEEEELEK